MIAAALAVAGRPGQLVAAPPNVGSSGPAIATVNPHDAKPATRQVNERAANDNDGAAASHTAGLPVSVEVTAAPFGAKGDGVVDDTASVQRAIDAASENGGAVHFPPGRYMVHDLRIVKVNGVSLVGDSAGYAPAGLSRGSALVYNGAQGGVIVKVFDAYDTTLRNLVFDGNKVKGVDAVLIDSDNHPVTRHVAIDNCRFFRALNGIHINSYTYGDTCTDHIWLQNLRFYELDRSAGAAVIVNSMNAAMVNLTNCDLGDGRYGLRLLRAGPVVMNNVAGGGNPAMDFVSVEGPRNVLTLITCQAEQSRAFMNITLLGASGHRTITLIGCKVDSPIECASTTSILSIGTEYTASVNLNGDSCYFVEFESCGTTHEVNRKGRNDVVLGMDGELHLPSFTYSTQVAITIPPGETYDIKLADKWFGQAGQIFAVQPPPTLPEGLMYCGFAYGGGGFRLRLGNLSRGAVTLPAGSTFVITRHQGG